MDEWSQKSSKISKKKQLSIFLQDFNKNLHCSSFVLRALPFVSNATGRIITISYTRRFLFILRNFDNRFLNVRCRIDVINPKLRTVITKQILRERKGIFVVIEQHFRFLNSNRIDCSAVENQLPLFQNSILIYVSRSWNLNVLFIFFKKKQNEFEYLYFGYVTSIYHEAFHPKNERS